jgi:hypothetical protein
VNPQKKLTEKDSSSPFALFHDKSATLYREYLTLDCKTTDGRRNIMSMFLYVQVMPSNRW